MLLLPIRQLPGSSIVELISQECVRMTTKLYLDNPYRKKCYSEIIEQTQVQGKPGAILNQTVFYPTSGGQPHDTGTIDNVTVIDVYEGPNRQIVHLLEKPLSGRRVECEINWERRFDHMQQHTGQHILSQALLKISDADTISFHLGGRSATIDTNQSGLTPEKIIQIEQLANRIICENRNVIGHMVDKSELHRFAVRQPPTVEDQIRILEIKDFDYSPCGGTHCKQTGEIGIIKIKRHENYKGGTRIHFVCGFRALKDYQNTTEILKELSSGMRTAITDLPQHIIKLKEDLKMRTIERNQLSKKLLDAEADSLISVGKIHADILLINKLFYDRPPKEIKLLAKKIVEISPDTVILFGIKAERRAQLFFQCSETLDFNMDQLMESACRVINGRGGGRPQQAQGGGSAVEKIENALQSAQDMLLKMIGE
jgi:alanyl-tRNA synthetase